MTDYQSILKEIDQKNNSMQKRDNNYYKNHVFVGFWKDLEEPGMDIFSKIPLKDLPEQNTQIDHSKKNKIINKIFNLQILAEKEEYFGCSYCRVCNKSNGGKEYTFDKYVWPEGYLHYIAEHDIKIDPEFENFLDEFTPLKI